MRLALVWLLIAACGGKAAPLEPAAGAPPPVVASNVLREDYAGSRACADCHGAIYETWESSPMRNMTRDAETATIRAPFDGASLRVGNDTAVMETVGGKRTVRVTTAQGKVEHFTVTKVVGGRYREDFVGTDEGGVERVLPATYVFATKSWRYKGYSVMVKERPAMGTDGRWSQECLPCHNTLPLATMYYDDLDPVVPAYQGKLSDRVMPAAKKWQAKTLDPDGLVTALAEEIRFLGGEEPKAANAHESLVAAAVAAEAKLDGPHLVELGVGCEACHNGAKVHAAEPTTKPTFAVATGLFAVTPPRGETGTNAQWINHTCAKCHTVLFSRYPWTWEGGNRRKNPGGSSISSGEGRDYQLGACQSKMACTQCHDPHTMDTREKLDAMATPAGNATCTGCHPQYAAADALKAHAHHDPAGAGASCVGCHMPKKNMGLDYALIRYHRIGSPDDPTRVEQDRPVECALCHADKSVAQLVTTMEGWWGKTYDRAALQRLYGDDLTVNALRATLFRGKAHEQAVAIAVFGQAKQRDAVPAIVEQLANEYPLVRYFAQRSLQTITGDPVAIDVGAPAADVRVQAQAWLAAWTAKH